MRESVAGICKRRGRAVAPQGANVTAGQKRVPLAGWLVWIGLAGLLGLALYNWRTYQTEWNGRAWGTFGVLFAATILTALFLGIELPTSALPVPGLPEEPPGSTLMLSDQPSGPERRPPHIPGARICAR